MLILQLTAVDVFIAAQPVLHVENAIRLPGIGIAALAAAFPSPRVHGALATIASLLFAGFIAFSFR